MPLYVLLLFILFYQVFLFFTVCLLDVIVRMDMYVMFLLRQRRLNKLIIIIIVRYLEDLMRSNNIVHVSNSIACE